MAGLVPFGGTRYPRAIRSRKELEPAVAAAPDVMTCAIGVNDVLQPGFSATAFAADYDHVIATLAAAATRGVLTR